jgi:GT2 family glycosyltransferase
MRKLKNIKNQILFFYEKYGLWATIKKCIIRLFSKDSFVERSKRYYNYWLKENVPTEEELEKQRNTKFEKEPKISIVVPMYNTPEEYFKDIITCMKEQTYSNWELCLADGSEEENHELDKYYKDDERIKYRHLDKNDGISGNTNEGLKLVTGDYVGLLDHDDVLPRECLFEVVKCINENPDVEFIYTDEDKLLDTWETKNRHDPHFKPDFSPDTLSSNNYITHFVVMTKELMIDKLKGFRKEYNGAQDFDLVLRASEETDKIVHISKVLYHWRVHDGSTAKVADSKPWAYEAGKLASQHHLDRLGLKAIVDHSNDIPGVYKVQYEVIGNPKVCIIIPNKDSVNLLKTCVNSILEKTIYDNYEIDIVENNSEKDETFEYYKELEKNPKIKILYYQDKGFNYSKIINFGVKNTESDFVLQLNNDTELLTPDWLEHFIGFAQQKRIGCVGARLMYKDKSIQHAGIAYGVCGLAANLMPGVPWGMHGYYGREALLRNVSAVTGACLFCRRELYEEVGYMDENDFAVAFNDVDFCLKIAQKGYLNIYNPYIMLMHYESKSRGDDDRNKKRIERFKNESEKFRAKWHDLLEKPDPYYNINFSKRTAMFDIRTDKVNCTTDYDYDTERYLTRKKKHEKRK